MEGRRSITINKAKEWVRSNRFSLLVLKYTISNDIKNTIIGSIYAMEYLASIEKHLKGSVLV
jgi:hypothetical protein